MDLIPQTISEELESLAQPPSSSGFGSIPVGCSSSDQRVEKVQQLFRLGASATFCDTESFIARTLRFMEAYTPQRIDQMRVSHYAKYLSGGGVGRGSLNGRCSRSSFIADAAVDAESSAATTNARTSLSSCGTTPSVQTASTECEQSLYSNDDAEDAAREREQADIHAARRQQMKRQISAARRAAHHAEEAVAAAKAEAEAGVAAVERANAHLEVTREATALVRRERKYNTHPPPHLDNQIKAWWEIWSISHTNPSLQIEFSERLVVISGEEVEAAASEAERKVAEMVQDTHKLRTGLLERKHQQFTARRQVVRAHAIPTALEFLGHL